MQISAVRGPQEATGKSEDVDDTLAASASGDPEKTGAVPTHMVMNFQDFHTLAMCPFEARVSGVTTSLTHCMS